MNYYFKLRHSVCSLAFIACLAFLPSVSFAADEVTYDPYAPAWKQPEGYDSGVPQSSEKRRFFARILEQPFRPVGHTAGKTAELVERTHLVDKTIWFYDKLASYGIYLDTRSPTDGGMLGPAATVKLEQLFGLEEYPLDVEVYGGWTPNYQLVGSTVDFGLRYRLESPEHTPFYHEGKFSYWRSSSESFFGIGPDTSLGDWTTYQPEEVRLESSIGYKPFETAEAKASVVYQHMNIGNGNRERVGKIKEYFARASVPGLSGGNIIGVEIALKHDTRDQTQDAREGGYENLGFGYYHDIDASDFQYITMKGEAAHFFKVFSSDRRILAARIIAQKHQEVGADDIPFYNMSRLGGGPTPISTVILRSFRPNRFFGEGVLLANIEYRYRIYEYGSFTGEAFALLDVGEIFNELGDIGFEELQASYGGGFNLKYRRRNILSFTLARGNEGWRSSLTRSISF